MFSFRRRRSARGGVVGLALQSDGFAITRLASGEDGSRRLELCESVDAVGPDRQAALSRLVKENGLAGMECVCVLGEGDYSLRLVERPDVEPDELRDAIAWTIRDLFDLDPSEAEFDVFDPPPDATPGRPAMVYVAAARADLVRDVGQLVAASGLTLRAIDIPELATRNVVDALPESVAGTAVVELGAKEGLLTICHQGGLYLARGISSGTAALDAAMTDAIAPGDDGQLGDDVRAILDDLLLELQRSLDYYESQLRRAPASRLLIAPADLEVAQIVPYLSEQLRPVSVSALALEEVVECESPVPQSAQARGLRAVGAALRGEPGEVSFQAHARPEAGMRFSMQTLQQVAGATAAVLALLFGVGFWQTQTARAELEVVRSAHDEVEARVESLRAALAEQAPAAEVEVRVEALRAETVALTRLVHSLGSESASASNGFSSVLAGLARRPVEGLWLTRIEVRAGGDELAIHGHALDPELVPRLLQRLREEPDFQDTSFAVFRLNDSETAAGVSDFSLEGWPDAEATP